ncbi:MAG: tyrosine-type recombinase/integrase [Parvibaculaceae bacterium]
MSEDDPAEEDSNSKSDVERHDGSSEFDVKRDDHESLARDLVPAVNWQNLPRIDFGSFISSHANAVDALCKELGSEHSRRTYVSRLNKIGRMLESPMPAERIPWHLLRYEHVLEIKAALERAGDSPATVNGTLSAIRKVTQVCVRLKRMDREDMIAIHDIKTIKYQRLPKGREIRAGELEALIRVCRDDKNQVAGWRDIAVIGFLYICGLRRFEVASLDIERVDLDDKSAMVVGKGNKEKRVFLDPGTVKALETWLAHRTGEEGPLFLPVKKSGVIQYTGRISDQTIYNIIEKRQRQAGVQKCSPHDFRRTFATGLLRQGIDLPTVQRLMGHADPSTTTRYDVREAEEDRAATTGLHLPV